MRSMRRSFCVLSFLFLLRSAVSVAQVGNTPRPGPATRITAVLSAMTLEIEAIGQEVTDKKEMTIQGIRFTTGSLKDRRVVLAHSGVGKVNAAMTATLLVEQFQPTQLRRAARDCHSSRGPRWWLGPSRHRSPCWPPTAKCIGHFVVQSAMQSFAAGHIAQ